MRRSALATTVPRMEGRPMHPGLNWKELPGRLWQQFWRHRVPDQSAILSFYFVVSIFPLLLFLMTLLGLILQSEHEFRNVLRHYLEAVVPRWRRPASSTRHSAKSAGAAAPLRSPRPCSLPGGQGPRECWPSSEVSTTPTRPPSRGPGGR